MLWKKAAFIRELRLVQKAALSSASFLKMLERPNSGWSFCAPTSGSALFSSKRIKRLTERDRSTCWATRRAIRRRQMRTNEDYPRHFSRGMF